MFDAQTLIQFSMPASIRIWRFHCFVVVAATVPLLPEPAFLSYS